MRMNSYSRYPSAVAVPYFVLFVYMPLVFVNSPKQEKKERATTTSAWSWMLCLFAFLLLLGAVAEAKLKLTTPSSAGIIPSRSVVDCCFIPKNTVRKPRYFALLVCAYMFFFRPASCFTGQSSVSCSLIMYRACANVLLPPKPALNPQSYAHDIGRF